MNELQAKIKALRASGAALHAETSAPLTDEERKILNRARNGQITMYILFDLALTAFPFLPFEDAVWEYQVASSVGLFLLITSLVFAVWRKMTVAHSTIPKKILKGIVTNKEMHSGKKATHYELTVGDSVPFPVSPGQYHSYQIGDGAEIHYWSGWGTHVFSVKRPE
jgi:hypothetical protein